MNRVQLPKHSAFSPRRGREGKRSRVNTPTLNAYWAIKPVLQFLDFDWTALLAVITQLAASLVQLPRFG